MIEIARFPSADEARLRAIQNIDLLHKDFCKDVLLHIERNIEQGVTDAWKECSDSRISPDHPVIQNFKQEMEKKGYEVKIEEKGNGKWKRIKSVTVYWGVKEEK